MQNTPYNQKIAEQLKAINDEYLVHLNKTGKQVVDSDLVPLVKPNIKYEGEGLLSGILGSLGMGKEVEGGKKRGRPSKKDKQMVASGFLDEMRNAHFGFGKRRGRPSKSKPVEAVVKGGKRRGRPSKKDKQMMASGFFDDMVSGISQGFAMPFQLANKVLGGKKSKEDKEGGLIKIAKGKAHYGKQSISVKSGNGVGRAVGCGNAGMEGAGIFDDIGSFVGNVKKVLPLAAMVGIGKKGGKRGRPRKAGNVGVEAMAEHRNALTGGAKKSSKWIDHVKAYAKKHNMKYSECLKDAKCKSSYKK